MLTPMIPREAEQTIRNLAGKYPVVTVTGPRQSGKTTLCRAIFPGKPYFNLETPDVRRFAKDDPRGFLAQCPDGAVFDEIQRAPDLLSYIQGIVDEQQLPGMFIVTGSQQFEVMNSVNQSLAGRTALLKLLPLTIDEAFKRRPAMSTDEMLLTGFYPRILDQDLDPTQALGDYFETYVERDIRQLAAIKDLSLFEKFVRLCAGRVGQLLNLQSLGNDTGVSHTTVRAWLTLLEASFVVFLLKPWHDNVSKRQIKSPKLYFIDVGLASYLLGIETPRQMTRDPLRGNLFENLVVVEALKQRYNSGRRSNLYFYRDGKGHEIDLILEHGRDVLPIEIKSGATIADDYFSSLDHFSRLETSRPWGNALVYGGSAPQSRTGLRIVPVSQMRSLYPDPVF
jgi:predicted AAA+ superfamily ATPase